MSQCRREENPTPLSYPHWLSHTSSPARGRHRHSNKKLCKLAPTVTQYYKGWLFLLLPWSLCVCTHSYYGSDFVAFSAPPAPGFILKIPKHRERCWHCHQHLMAESRVRSRSAAPPGSAPANSKCRKSSGEKCRKKYRDGAEAEIIAKVRRFKWSREYKKLIEIIAKKRQIK